MCRLQTPLAGLLATLLPRARIVPAVKGEDMSADPEAIKTMEEDPLNSQGNVRARTANELLKAFGHVAEQESQLELPIYAHHGGEDRLANLGVSCLLYPVSLPEQPAQALSATASVEAKPNTCLHLHLELCVQCSVDNPVQLVDGM